MKQQADRLKSVIERREMIIQEKKLAMTARLADGDLRREKQIAATARKAGSENEKVDEILFINLMTVENAPQALQARLEESDKRRNKILDKIQARQRIPCRRRKSRGACRCRAGARISTLKDNMERRQRGSPSGDAKRLSVGASLSTQEKKSGLC